MMNIRLVGLPLLLAATACAPGYNSTRATLEPKNGPKAHLYVHYSGGLTERTVRTSFKTDENAHVIVARLGGDGRVEVLYPETPSSPTLVQSGKTYEAATFDANYDAIPQLFSYASRMPRSYGARVSSYDGRGNGFIFVIATQYPMFTEALDDHGQWSDSLVAEGYHTAYDPRVAVKDFAEVITRGMPYTLDYASVFTSTGYTGFADASMDCSRMISAFGTIGTLYHLRMMGALSPWGYYSPFASGIYGGYASSYGACGNSGYAFSAYEGRCPGVNGGNILWYAAHGGTANCGYGYRRYGFYEAGWGNPPWAYGVDWMNQTPRITPVTTVATTPEPTRPRGFNTAARRPGFRNGDESGSAINVTRPRFDGQRSKPTTNSWAPPIQQTRTYVDRNDHYGHANGGSGSGSSGGTSITRTEGVTSHPSQPASQPVHRETPAPVSHKVAPVVTKDP